MAASLHGQHKALEYLIGLGADPDTRDDLGNAALHDCAMRASLRSMQLLLDNGANIDVMNNNGMFMHIS